MKKNIAGLRHLRLPLLVALSLSGAVQAQESVNAALDSCVNKERVKSTLKGALAGAVLGFAKAKVEDNAGKDSTGKSMLTGAAIGGAAGFVTAHFQAVGKCYGKNPAWVPESKVERSADYDSLRKQWNYKAEDGIVAKTMQVSLPASVKPGSKLDLASNFGVLTPDGAEADVVIERRLFAVLDGKEFEVHVGAKAHEQRKLEVGSVVDRFQLPIPTEMPAGTAFRYVFSVNAAGQPPSIGSATTTVN